jgi:hypothetical protein
MVSNTDYQSVKKEQVELMRESPNDCFVVFAEYMMVAKYLPKKQRDALAAAYVDYGLYGIWPDSLRGIALAIFKSHAGAITRGLEKSKNGKLGGRPKKTTEE